MLHLPVAVLVGMPEGAVGGNPFQILGCMVVRMMRIATMGIMVVAMGMTQALVVMRVAVLLQQQQHHTCGHQSRGNE